MYMETHTEFKIILQEKKLLKFTTQSYTIFNEKWKIYRTIYVKIIHKINYNASTKLMGEWKYFNS